MNKALHVLVYLVLLVSAAALFFEIKLYDKKELLKDRTSPRPRPRTCSRTIPSSSKSRTSRS